MEGRREWRVESGEKEGRMKEGGKERRMNPKARSDVANIESPDNGFKKVWYEK